MISRSFQTVRRMREEWKWETYVRSQSFSSESPVNYFHVGRRKIQISPSLGEQDQSNTLPQGQQRQSNFHPVPCLPPPPAGITLIGALLWEPDFFKKFLSCKHSEDWVIRDNGFGRNSSFWPFCYCFYSRLLFNCRSVQ